MLTMRLGAAAQQRAAMSPRLQQAVRLLQMSSLDFAALLRDKADRNPFLEVDDAEPEAPGPPEAAVDAPMPDERDLWFADAGIGPRRTDGDLSALEGEQASSDPGSEPAYDRDYDVVEPEPARRPVRRDTAEPGPGDAAGTGRHVPRPNYRHVFSALRKRIGKPLRRG